MRFLGIYFTGTGNSKRVMDVINHNLISLQHTLDTVDVIKDEIKDINEYDGLIITYPIYGFNAPKPIISYVKKMVKANENKPCLIMKQSGEHLFWNNASSLYLTSLLKKRNITVTNEYHYLMPYSFIFRHSDFMAYRMNNVMEGLIPLDLNDFFSHKDSHMKRFFLDRFFAWVLRIQWWGGRFNGRFYKVEKNKCVKCMKCVKECPACNIEFKDGKFKFKGQCLMCQRCIMYCPRHAIKVGMFNSWRVDEPYTFKEVPYQKERHPNYCKKNYQKYFKVSEERIEKSKAA
ncbi:MAG: EFR1 family ferrodoxin [Bacilli bacterium]|nr:EFR1 family ferrodoxin [Bacilli bacterium]